MTHPCVRAALAFLLFVVAALPAHADDPPGFADAVRALAAAHAKARADGKVGLPPALPARLDAVTATALDALARDGARTPLERATALVLLAETADAERVAAIGRGFAAIEDGVRPIHLHSINHYAMGLLRFPLEGADLPVLAKLALVGAPPNGGLAVLALAKADDARALAVLLALGEVRLGDGGGDVVEHALETLARGRPAYEAVIAKAFERAAGEGPLRRRCLGVLVKLGAKAAGAAIASELARAARGDAKALSTRELAQLVHATEPDARSAAPLLALLDRDPDALEAVAPAIAHVGGEIPKERLFTLLERKEVATVASWRAGWIAAALLAKQLVPADVARVASLLTLPGTRPYAVLDALATADVAVLVGPVREKLCGLAESGHDRAVVVLDRADDPRDVAFFEQLAACSLKGGGSFQIAAFRALLRRSGDRTATLVRALAAESLVRRRLAAHVIALDHRGGPQLAALGEKDRRVLIAALRSALGSAENDALRLDLLAAVDGLAADWAGAPPLPPDERKSVVTFLAAIARSDASRTVKEYLCGILWAVPSAETLAALEHLTQDPNLAQYAGRFVEGLRAKVARRAAPGRGE